MGSTSLTKIASLVRPISLSVVIKKDLGKGCRPKPDVVPSVFPQFPALCKTKGPKDRTKKRHVAEPITMEMSLPQMACDEKLSSCKRIQIDDSYGTGKATAEKKVKVLNEKGQIAAL